MTDIWDGTLWLRYDLAKRGVAPYATLLTLSAEEVWTIAAKATAENLLPTGFYTYEMRVRLLMCWALMQREQIKIFDVDEYQRWYGAIIERFSLTRDEAASVLRHAPIAGSFSAWVRHNRTRRRRRGDG